MALSEEKILELLELELGDLKCEGVGRILFNFGLESNRKDRRVADGYEMGHPGSEMDDKRRIALPIGDKISRYEWLKNKVLTCDECNKHCRPGKLLVFGEGSLDADIFFCGEAPGADEETLGRPFVGRAGQLLDKVIAAMGLSRAVVYIANIMNWRPEMPTAVGNRPPTHAEMAFCIPYLIGQIEVVQPKVVVALGATAAKGLLGVGTFRSLQDVRGGWHTFAGIPLRVTFHPSYLLRNNTNSTKRAMWEDMLAIMAKLNMPISEKQRNYFL